MTWTHNFTFLYKFILLIGLPFVHFYCFICSNVFLSTAATDASGLERLGNQLLIPYQYVFTGQTATPTHDPDVPYVLTHKFDYNTDWESRTLCSVILLPQSIFLGSFCKGISFLSHEARTRHNLIKKSGESTVVKSNLDHYGKIGMVLSEIREEIPCLGCCRRAGDENNLKDDKNALKDIIAVLEQAHIPYWIDCGTCLGAYRYGGVIPWDNDIDIAILQPDFDNVKRALNLLDSNRYGVLDWSGRDVPKTFLKVHVKGTDILIDIYVYTVDEHNKTLTYSSSNINNIFMSDEFKKRESTYITPVPFDMIFPLKKASFDGLEVAVPNRTEEFLKVRYGDNLDPIMIYDVARDSYIKDSSHPYWSLLENAGSK